LTKPQRKQLYFKLDSDLEVKVMLSPTGIHIGPTEMHAHMTDEQVRNMLGITLSYETMIQRGIVPASEHFIAVGKLIANSIYTGDVPYFQLPTEMRDEDFQNMMRAWEVKRYE